jgi:hypothetical protein
MSGHKMAKIMLNIIMAAKVIIGIKRTPLKKAIAYGN